MKRNTISMDQLAKICNVSQGTVDRALHNRSGINDSTRRHILEVARKYGYRPAGENKNRLIGIIVFDLYNEYFSQLIVEIERRLREFGYCSLVMFSDKDKKSELECIEKMYNAGVEGLVICPVNYGEDFEKYLHSWKIPVVTVGNMVEGVKYVGVNNSDGMYELTEKIIDMGYKRLLYFSPALRYEDVNLYGQKQRYNGFLKATGNNSVVDFSVVTEVENIVTLDDDSCAVIASTDYYALSLRSFKRDFPGLVAGFDNVSGTDLFDVPYITVDCNISGVVSELVEYFMGKSTEDNVFVPHRIIYKKF